MFDCIWTYSDYRRVNRIEKEKKQITEKVKFKAVLKYWLLKK